MTDNPTAQKSQKVADVTDSWIEMKNGLIGLERAAAGHTKLSGALAGHQGQKTTARAQGLPIFTMPASADGRTKVEVALDLRYLDPAYVPHVLAPLIHMQAVEVLNRLTEVEGRIAEIRQYYQEALAPKE